MTPYDPATIRRLAESGDAFYKGAAWLLDEQAKARAVDYDSPWQPVELTPTDRNQPHGNETGNSATR